MGITISPPSGRRISGGAAAVLLSVFLVAPCRADEALNTESSDEGTEDAETVPDDGTGAKPWTSQDDIEEFPQAGLRNATEVEEQLLTQLKASLRPNMPSDRIAKIEKALLPMYTALPKDQTGTLLEHRMVRYALHRILAQMHGWYVKGLEPDGRNDSTTLMSSMSVFEEFIEWVPTHLQTYLEKRLGGEGSALGIHEVAVMVATIEDLVHREAIERLDAIYHLHHLNKSEKYNQSFSDTIIDTFIVIYNRGGDWSPGSDEEAWFRLANFKRNLGEERWKPLDAWLRSVREDKTRVKRARKTVPPKLNLAYGDFVRIVEEIGDTYGFFMNSDCGTLKKTLLGMEDKRPGRVLLSTFYEKALISRWAFTEKYEYLRDMGILDETDADMPRVVVSNYINSRPQCMDASNFYVVCCLNECESLLHNLEKEIGAPTASPERLAELVGKMPSSTVPAPQISLNLMSHLKQAAEAYGGSVPLHGRLFAQWLHHVYPRECPFPHETGTTWSPQSPEKWMKQTGQNAIATDEEMKCHISGNCAGGAEAAKKDKAGPESDDADDEIPWFKFEL